MNLLPPESETVVIARHAAAVVARRKGVRTEDILGDAWASAQKAALAGYAPAQLYVAATRGSIDGYRREVGHRQFRSGWATRVCTLEDCAEPRRRPPDGGTTLLLEGLPDSLPDEAKTLLLDRFVERKTVAEIAAARGVHPQTIKTRFRELFARLDPDGGKVL